MTTIRDYWAVDVHAHYGFMHRPEQPELTQNFGSGDGPTVAARARASRISLTVVSPLTALMPRGRADAVAGNIEAQRVVSATPGLLQWVVLNPLQPETFQQARQMLALPNCVGIKIHPEEHCYPITEHGAAIFSFAASQGCVVLSHSGEGNSLPADFVPFADQYPEMKLILAHIGCSTNFDRTLQVRAIQRGKRGNIFADTSSAMSITPGLIEWAVKEVGPERILFGTDAPLYSTAVQRERINSAELDDGCKQLILRDNALRLLTIDSLMTKDL